MAITVTVPIGIHAIMVGTTHGTVATMAGTILGTMAIMVGDTHTMVVTMAGDILIIVLGMAITEAGTEATMEAGTAEEAMHGSRQHIGPTLVEQAAVQPVAHGLELDIALHSAHPRRAARRA